MFDSQRLFLRLLSLAREGDTFAASEFECRFRDPLTKMIRRKLAARQRPPSRRVRVPPIDEDVVERCVQDLIAGLLAPPSGRPSKNAISRPSDDATSRPCDDVLARRVTSQETRRETVECPTIVVG